MALLIAQPERLQSAATGRSLRAHLSLPVGTEPAERARIYTGGYPARLQSAIAESHPAVAHVLGEGAFAKLVERYARALPPRSYNLNDAGARLAEYLPADPLSAHLPFLSDLARLEWAIAQAFHAAAPEPFDPAAVALWSVDDWDGARIDLHAGTAVVRSQWPIRTVWAAREMPVKEIDIDMVAGGEIVLIRRAGLEVVCESIGAGEATAIEALLDGARLGEVSQRMASTDAGTFAAHFARWLRTGLIVACRRNGAAPADP
jgi:hypothetical protein